MSIITDVKQLSHSQVLDLFELDQFTTPNQVFRFCNHSGVSFGGVVYQPLAFQSGGWDFKASSSGLPRPRLVVSNVLGTVSSLIKDFNDLLGARVRRTRTLVKYLDGQPTANFNEKFSDQIYYIDRKVKETKNEIEWQLATKIDLEGVQLPKRIIIASTCGWRYRSVECGYTGPPVATSLDVATTDPGADDCSLRVSGCQLRFGQFGLLPFGGFPGCDSF